LRFLVSATTLALALLLAACGSGGGGSSSTATTAPASEPDITLTAGTHHPRAGAPWPIAIRAYGPDGRPLRAEVRYQYLFGGAVVARRSHYRFRGTFHDTFRWPARSAGVPLTFRAVVTTPLGKRNLDYAVTVRK
jgi:hypothetical protein